MPKPPVPEGYFDKVNYVIDAWSNPLCAPWYIYVEAMGPAALEAFITLITFGWDDAARGYFRPRGLHQRRSGKRKGKWRRATPRFPEIGEEIGKRLPGADQVKGERWSVLGKALWRIDTVLQQGLFYWLVADVTVDFAVNWTSLLYEADWPDTPGPCGFSFKEAGPIIFGGGSWVRAAMSEEDYQDGPPDWIVTKGGTGSRPARITYAMDFDTPFGSPRPAIFETRLVDEFNDLPLNQTKTDLDDTENSGTLVLSTTVPRNTIFHIDVRTNMTGANWKRGVVTGQSL